MQKLLGKDLFDKINKIVSFNSIAEIRLRIGKRIFIKLFDRGLFIDEVANEKLMSNILFVATNGSMYAYERQISEGYLDYFDGIRIGICGECVYCDDKRISVKKIYSLCSFFPFI